MLWHQRERQCNLPDGVLHLLALSPGQRPHPADPPPNRGRGGEASSSGSAVAAGRQQEQQQQQQPGSLGLLVQAVQMHPLVVVRLQQKLKDKGVGHEAEWEALLRQPLFAKGGGRDSASLGHLVDIFVERQHLLWKAPEVQVRSSTSPVRTSKGDSFLSCPVLSAGAIQWALWPGVKGTRATGAQGRRGWGLVGVGMLVPLSCLVVIPPPPPPPR